jgi:hypothetical protein
MRAPALRLGALPLVLTFAVAACDSATTPGDPLDPADALFLAELMDASLSELIDDSVNDDDLDSSDPAVSSSASASVAGATSGQPVVWHRTWEEWRDCPDGGRLTVAGSGTSTWDPSAASTDVEASGTQTRDECAHTRNGVVITLDGSAAWTHERHHRNHTPSGVWITTYLGGFDWIKSTGKSGSCFIDLTRTVDTEANTRRLHGTFCGSEVDKTVAWR